jgi:hypothetical protein
VVASQAKKNANGFVSNHIDESDESMILCTSEVIWRKRKTKTKRSFYIMGL